MNEEKQTCIDDIPCVVFASAKQVTTKNQLTLEAIVRESNHPEDCDLYQVICKTDMNTEHCYSVWEFDAEKGKLQNGLPVTSIIAAIRIVCDRLMFTPMP